MSNVETINVARKVATKQLPEDCHRDWLAFDERVYKALRNMELMRKLSDEEGIVSDLMLLDFMGLGDEFRHVLRLSVLHQTVAGKFKRRQGQQTWTNLVTTVRYNAVMEAQHAAHQRKIASLLKS